MTQHDDTASLRHMLDHAKEVIISSLLSSQNSKISWIQSNATPIPLPYLAVKALAAAAAKIPILGIYYPHSIPIFPGFTPLKKIL